MRSLTREEVRQIDRIATEKLGVPGVVLMENAGRNVADAVEDFLRGLQGRKIAIVAGAGNNGGDGCVAARHLLMREAEVAVFLVAPAEKITGDAAINLNIVRKLGLDIRQVAIEAAPRGAAGPVSAGQAAGAAFKLDELGEILKRFDLVVDAVGGTGIQGPLTGGLAAAVEQINAAGRPVVAIDIPTGLDCDTGAAPGPTVRAALTVTFTARKAGFDAPEAAAYTGKVVVADIGIPADRVATLST